MEYFEGELLELFESQPHIYHPSDEYFGEEILFGLQGVIIFVFLGVWGCCLRDLLALIVSGVFDDGGIGEGGFEIDAFIAGMSVDLAVGLAVVVSFSELRVGDGDF